MIEKMRKYSFLVYHNDYDTFVEKLYELGVIDIIEKEKAQECLCRNRGRGQVVGIVESLKLKV